jgi:DNA-binding GntR family transcriptional regulator
MRAPVLVLVHYIRAFRRTKLDDMMACKWLTIISSGSPGCNDNPLMSSVPTIPTPRARRAAAPQPLPGAPAPAGQVSEPAPAPSRAAEDSLHAAITRALLGGQLRPGTPLRERYLAEEFGVTRGLVRKVLLRLGQEGKLEMHANRGAFVPQPTPEQVRQAYGARQAVEAGLLAVLGHDLQPEQLARLKAHLRAERAASRRARRDESVRLAGDFHLLLADLVGNPELRAILQRLIARTQMFVALFEPAQSSDCAPEEHAPIVDALERGDTPAAVGAMLAHLRQVEARVLAAMPAPGEPGVAEILRAALLDAD